MPKGQDWKLNIIWFFKLLFSLKCFSLLGEYSRYRIWHCKLSRSISRNLRLYHKVNPFNSYPKMVRHTLKILQHLLYVWSGILCMNVVTHELIISIEQCWISKKFKVNESRYKQCRGNPTLFHRANSMEKNIKKR